MYKNRIGKIQAQLIKENLDGLLVTRLAHIRYLCGYSGSSGLLIIRRNDAHFLTDFRYKDQAAKEVKGARVMITKADPISELKDLTQFQGKNQRYGFESAYTTHSDLQRIQSGMGKALVLPTSDLVEQFSTIKDSEEIASLQKAIDITDTAFERILGYIRPGLRENEVRAELEYQMMSLGSERPAFDTIIASGFRSAMPHGVATDKKIRKGDFVTLDFGAMYNGYTADLTRTVMVGKANTRQKKIYSIVLKAQVSAIKKVKSGIEGKAVDKVARDIITRAGFGKNFGHGLGHGIGVYIHSKPNVGPRSTETLKSGMVITIEPGIYVSGWGGVRIEDDVLVTTTGCRVMTRSPKNLFEL